MSTLTKGDILFTQNGPIRVLGVDSLWRGVFLKDPLGQTKIQGFLSNVFGGPEVTGADFVGRVP